VPARSASAKGVPSGFVPPLAKARDARWWCAANAGVAAFALPKRPTAATSAAALAPKVHAPLEKCNTFDRALEERICSGCGIERDLVEQKLDETS